MLSRQVVLLTAPIPLRLRRNSHGIRSFADLYPLNSFVSYRYEKHRGPTSPRRSDAPPYFRHISFSFKPLRTLLRCCKTQTFSFQVFPNSLPKTTRGGVSLEGRLFRGYPPFPFPCPLSALLYI